LLASVQNYPELEEALTRDVTMLLFPESSRLPQSPAELAAAVKEWLDMNYAEDISFRTLTETFLATMKNIYLRFLKLPMVSPRFPIWGTCELKTPKY
jgi:hypothetical protein